MKRNRDALKLIGFLLLVYAPFLGFRVARMAGDEKVYTAQAIEMERAGHWFLQTLFGAHEYFKGPLHYLLIRFGSIFLGHTMWATVWMNMALLLGGAYSIFRLMRRHGPERPRGLALFAGAAFGVSAGVYGYMFASQMEAELASAFAIAINLFDRSFILPGRTRESSRQAEWAFWIVAGLTGWFKSPLYSGLLGVSALLGWAFQGKLKEKLASRQTWGPLLLGVFVCAAGYLPPLIWDREAVFRTYWLRETFGKNDNGGTWWEAIFALSTSFLFPWCFLAFGSYVQAGLRSFRPSENSRSPGVIRLERHTLAWLLPSVTFFILFPYHGQSYNVPMIGPVILWIACELSAARGPWVKAQSAALGLTAASFCAFAALSAALAIRMQPRPSWLWAMTLPLCAIGASGTAAYFFQAMGLGRARDWGVLALATAPFYLGFGTLIANVGERELIDLRREVAGEKKVYYDELAHNLWSEWGYLNFMIAPVEVAPLVTDAELTEVLSAGRKVLVPGPDALKRVRQIVQGRYPGRKLEERPWRRWKLQGQDDSGTPLWKKAWEQADLSFLERDYFVVWLGPLALGK